MGPLLIVPLNQQTGPVKDCDKFFQEPIKVAGAPANSLVKGPMNLWWLRLPRDECGDPFVALDHVLITLCIYKGTCLNNTINIV